MNSAFIGEIYALVRFEFAKRYQFPFLEIFLVIFLFESFPTGGFYNTTRPLNQALSSLTSYLQGNYYGIDLNFIFIAVLVSLLITMSLGREYETNILKTILVQARISRKQYFFSKIFLDILMLTAVLFSGFIAYTFMYADLAPFRITMFYYIFYYTKILFAYALATILTVWRKQMLQPFLISLLFWFLIPIFGPVLVNKRQQPWYYLLNMPELYQRTTSEANLILVTFAALFFVSSLLILVGAAYMQQKNDLL